MLWWTLRRLRSRNPEERRLAAQELRWSRSAEAIEPLIIALKDSDWRVRRGAGEALETLKYKPPDQSQKAVMHIAFQRWNEAVALGSVAIEPFIGVFNDPEEYVRTAAAEALGKIGSTAVEPLLAALNDANGYVRSAAAEALGQIGDVRAVEPLIAALKDSEENVRRDAAEALGSIGDVRAVEPIIALLKDSDYVRPG